MEKIEILKSCNAADAKALARLLSELKDYPIQLGVEDVERVIKVNENFLIVARSDGKIVGMAHLQIIPSLGQLRSRLDDVVVDEVMRGRGVGKSLVAKALEVAEQQGADYNELTSNQDRKPAHGLYRSFGYEERETIVFRRTLPRE